MTDQICLKKWGNSLGIIIPHKIAKNLNLEEGTPLAIYQSENQLIIQKAETLPNLNEILDSIPENFTYPEDIAEFIRTEAIGEEAI